MKKVSEFKSNYCFRIQILNVIEHRVTERMSEDSEYPLLKSNSRANASPCTGELIGGMRHDKAPERERDGEPDEPDEMMRRALAYTAIKRVGGRSSTGLRPLAWVSPTPLGG